MWIAGTLDLNELKLHLPRTLCITLIRFTQNTIVDLINIKEKKTHTYLDIYKIILLRQLYNYF